MPHTAHPRRLPWLILSLILCASPTWAAGSAPSCDEDPTCQNLATQGMEFFSAGRYREAEERFVQAYAMRGDPALLYNLARTLHKAGRPGDAISYYRRFLDAGAAGDVEQRRKAEQYLAQAQGEAAQTPLAQVGTPNPPTSPSPVTAVQPLAAQPQPSTEKPLVPLYRKPWFWAIVGVAVAGAAVGIGVGVAARRPDLSDAMVARPFEP